MFRISFFIVFFLFPSFFLRAQPELPPPGMLVDMNGYKIHLIKKGNGGPAVIMFHGAGHIGLMWNLVLPKVAEFTTAVAVDQAGEGVEIPEAITTPLLEKPVLKSFQPRRDFGDLLDKFSEEDKARFNWIYNERPFTYVKGRGSYESETFELLYKNPEQYGFGNKPLIVITGGAKEPQQGDENWSSKQLKAHSEKLQKDLLNLSTNSRQIIAKKSGHQIHIDEPELVSKAIESVIERLKSEK